MRQILAVVKKLLYGKLTFQNRHQVLSGNAVAGFVEQMTPLPDITRLLGAERYAALEADVAQRK